MPTTHVITGGTGLVGSALILRIAQESDDEIVCLVRPGAGATAIEERLHRVLEQATHAYGTGRAVLDSALRRCRAVPGDITQDVGHITLPRSTGHVEFWHSAARMLFRGSERRASFASNVAGTRRTLALAQAAGADVFNYLSTAYVAGTAEGRMPEAPIVRQQARNPYERSKIAAERMVLACTDFPVRVLRPSVVVGHSTTLAYPGTPSGAYTIQRLIAAYCRATASATRPAPHRRLLVRADEPFNLVPIDQVAREAHEISLRDRTHGVFHLTNSAPPSTGELVAAWFANCGAPAPSTTVHFEDMNVDDLRLYSAIGVFNHYLNNPQDFDRSRTDEAVSAPGAAAWKTDDTMLRRLFRPFVGC